MGRSILDSVSKRRKIPDFWEAQLEAFFASNLSENAGAYLSEKARVALHLEGDRTYLFRRGPAKNQIRPAENPEADVHFFVPINTMRYLVELGSKEGSAIGTMGAAVVEHLFHGDEETKIRFRVNASFFRLWAYGYFSVLKAGGPEVASFLSKWGYGSLARLKDLLRQGRK